jgi:glutamine amidotransferase
MDIEKADKIILPGVGAFDSGMQSLKKFDLVEVLNKKVIIEKTPILGICLGMQLFAKLSEEGSLDGLGWLDANVVTFTLNNNNKSLKIPHMRWNTVLEKKSSYVFEDMYENPRFYFVHSYHLLFHDQEDILTTTIHGYEFVSSIQKGNIIGVQFHPEKSHKYGVKLLENFSNINRNA